MSSVARTPCLTAATRKSMRMAEAILPARPMTRPISSGATSSSSWTSPGLVRSVTRTSVGSSTSERATYSMRPFIAPGLPDATSCSGLGRRLRRRFGAAARLLGQAGGLGAGLGCARIDLGGDLGGLRQDRLQALPALDPLPARPAAGGGQNSASGLGGLCAHSQPIEHPPFIDDGRRRERARVVVTEVLEEAPIARAFLVGHDQTVARLMPGSDQIGRAS